MDIELLRENCLSLPYVEEIFPFDEYTLVFYVGSKLFALTDLQTPNSVNLKCDPDQAIELRERYMGIVPGYHMNKNHWITILLDGSVSEAKTLDFLDMSYDLIDNVGIK